jgi:hypothetical protein
MKLGFSFPSAAVQPPTTLDAQFDVSLLLGFMIGQVCQRQLLRFLAARPFHINKPLISGLLTVSLANLKPYKSCKPCNATSALGGGLPNR